MYEECWENGRKEWGGGCLVEIKGWSLMGRKEIEIQKTEPPLVDHAPLTRDTRVLVFVCQHVSIYQTRT